MGNPLPSSTSGDLHTLRWALGALLAALAFCASMLLGQGFGLIGAGALAILAFAFAFPAATTRLPRWFHTAMFPASLALFGTDFALTGELVSSLIRLDLLLLLYRACTPRKRRDDLQLILLGLFLVVITGVLTTSLLFGVLLVAFIATGMCLLAVRTLSEASAGADTPGIEALESISNLMGWRQEVRGWRRRLTTPAMLVWLGFSLAALPLAALIFLAIPRFELRHAIFLERLFARGTVTGFTENVRFGEISQIQKDNRVAFRFDAEDRPREQIYWRMVVLDEYRNSSFRSSPALQATAFGSVYATARIQDFRDPPGDNPLSGSMYFEPGVSRYLPVAGPFTRIEFNEAQMLRWSRSLHLVRLDREPAKLRAWRIQSMNTGSRIADREAVGKPEGAASVRYLQLPVDGEQRQQLEMLAESLRPQESPAEAAAFVSAASRWLRANHGYSLEMTLPPGTGDPLLRWLNSREPGHCELFAGSLVMLCRAAGIPARMVAGFAGGEWNEDYVIVRNSDAHAWVEYLDRGEWVRTDPTQGEAGEARAPGDALTPSLRTSESGWEAWTDRLRVLWYRRVVNFDQQDQKELIGATGDTVREQATEARQAFKNWLANRWSSLPRDQRIPAAIAVVLTFGAFLYLLVRLLRSWRGAPRNRQRRLAAQRLEASQWIAKLETRIPSAERDRLLGELRQVRFGASPHWPDVRPLVRQARSHYRAAPRSTLSPKRRSHASVQASEAGGVTRTS
ncbi:MAG: transglutaminaseTgpA domain-containing protein [Opitutaceae bacterium]|nr:transglutaminaseTgpA domain-containing protein [Opitutaceae bacterium]